jgi:hypothetical protein
MFFKRGFAGLATGLAAVAIAVPAASANAAATPLVYPAALNAPVMNAIAFGAPQRATADLTPSATADVTPVLPIPAADPSVNPTCPASYNGPTNAMTGCPFWLMVPSSST